MSGKPKVAFICVHNSCRSQIAEALGRLLAADTFESYSAGTETKPAINPDALRLVKARYGVDMAAAQRSKLLAELPPVDGLQRTVPHAALHPAGGLGPARPHGSG